MKMSRMCNAAYAIFIMWNSISGLDARYHFQLNISIGGALMVRSHQKKYQGTFEGRGGGGKVLEGLASF